MEGITQRRHEVRQAALPLYSERAFADVSFAEVAAAAGLTEAELVERFLDTRSIIADNDYWGLIVSGFRESSDDLSCAAAWVVAIEELAGALSQEQWDGERDRIALYQREELALGGVIAEMSGLLMGLNEAVAERSGLPVTSTEVATFSGTMLGTMLAMPIAFYPDAHTWVAAHGVAFDALGPGLDRMIRLAAES